LTGLRFFAAAFFSDARFSLAFFLAAIRAVYHRHIPAPNPSQTQTFPNFAPPIFRTQCTLNGIHSSACERPVTKP
jgi:hypothetical protein